MNETDLRFRLAQPADATQLGEFMERNFLAAYGHCSSPGNVRAAIEQHYGLAAQSRQIADPACWNLIASIGDAWAGHAQLKAGGNPPDGVGPQPVLELSRFYVDGAFHGQGVAQAMMAKTKAHARDQGAKALYLSVWQDQPQAIRFYRKEGFRIAGELVFMVGDDAKDDWLMTCPLD